MVGAFAARQAWLEGPLGASLVAAEAELLAGVMDEVFGLELLQLGSWGPPRALTRAARTRRQTLIAEAAPPGGADVLGRLTALPVQRDCIDAVLLPHTLEFEADPQAVVREADRVLTAEGQVIILGFRPLSLWGLRAAASRSGFPPGLRQLLPEARVRDWLTLLGYEVAETRRFLFSRPWQNGPAGQGRRILRRGLLNPLPASAWLLRARKRVYTLTVVKPRLRERPKVLAGGLAEPTRRARS